MKKKIFIFNYYMEVGGAERSLLGLLESIDYEKYDVDLFLAQHTGEFMDLIPSKVNLLPENASYRCFATPLWDVFKKGKWILFLSRLFVKIKSMFNNRVDDMSIFLYVTKAMSPFLPDFFKMGVYDLAISFISPHNLLREKVLAKKYIAWIHTDYSSVGVDVKAELPVWAAYDYVASISADVTKTFLQVFPSLKSKMVEIENILSPAFVRQRAELLSEKEVYKEIPQEKDVICLLTIGRYSFPKKLEEIPAICRHLLEKGIKVRWYIIGYGGSDEYIREAIREEGMEQHVFLLGKKANPYPYIKACDWYVQPSRYEGKSVVVREAQMLCKPVIITAYPTAASQVADGVDGVIVPLPVAECADAMATAIRDNALKEKLIAYLSTHDYGNMAEVEKLYALMN